MKRRVIKSKNLPAKLPIIQTLVIILALDYWKAPQWLWGAMGFMLLILWGASIYLIAIQEEVDIMDDTNHRRP